LRRSGPSEEDASEESPERATFKILASSTGAGIFAL